MFGVYFFRKTRCDARTYKLLAPPALLQPIGAHYVFDHRHGGEELDGARHLHRHQVGGFQVILCQFPAESVQPLSGVEQTHHHTQGNKNSVQKRSEWEEAGLTFVSCCTCGGSKPVKITRGVDSGGSFLLGECISSNLHRIRERKG